MTDSSDTLPEHPITREFFRLNGMFPHGCRVEVDLLNDHFLLADERIADADDTIVSGTVRWVAWGGDRWYLGVVFDRLLPAIEADGSEGSESMLFVPEADVRRRAEQPVSDAVSGHGDDDRIANSPLNTVFPFTWASPDSLPN